MLQALELLHAAGLIRKPACLALLHLWPHVTLTDSGCLVLSDLLQNSLQEYGYTRESALRLRRQFLAKGWAVEVGEAVVLGVEYQGHRWSLLDVEVARARAGIIAEWRSFLDLREVTECVTKDLEAALGSLSESDKRLFGMGTPPVEEKKKVKGGTYTVKAEEPEKKVPAGQGMLPLTGGSKRKAKKKKNKQADRAVWELETVWSSSMKRHHPEVPVAKWQSATKYKAKQALASYSDPVVLHRIVRYVVGRWEQITEKRRYIQGAYPSINLILTMHQDFAGEVSLIKLEAELKEKERKWLKENPFTFAPPEALMREMADVRKKLERAGIKTDSSDEVMFPS
jgi:hypothetical protein